MSVRKAFILAIARGQGGTILDALNGVEYKSRGDKIPVIYSPSQNVAAFAFKLGNVTHPTKISAGTNGEWTLFQVTSMRKSLSFCKWLFNRLATIAAKPANDDGTGKKYLLAPWPLPKFIIQFPSIAAQFLGEKGCAHVVLGDPPEHMAWGDIEDDTQYTEENPPPAIT